jgi:hypothetical protein
MLLIEYASRRGLSTWPKGARWPVEIDAPVDVGGETDIAKDDSVVDSTNRRLAQEQESQVREQTEKQKQQESRAMPATDGIVEPSLGVNSTSNSGENLPSMFWSLYWLYFFCGQDLYWL